MKAFVSVACAALLTAASFSATASDKPGTPEEAQAMVSKAVAFYKKNGLEKTVAEVHSKTSQFRDRDLYVVIYDQDMNSIAHGANQKQVGRNLIDVVDIDGHPFMRERATLAKTKTKGHQDYKYNNPVTKEIEPKRMYFEVQDKYFFGAGVYLPKK